MWNEERADHFQAHSAQKVMQMQLTISHEPIMKVPWGPSVRGVGAQSPGRHDGWRYPYTHKDWDAQATLQPPPFPRGELLEMEKQECIEYPESQKTARGEDTISTQYQRRASSSTGSHQGERRTGSMTHSLKGGRAGKAKSCLLSRGWLLKAGESACLLWWDGIFFLKFIPMLKKSNFTDMLLLTEQQIHKIRHKQPSTD